MRNKKKYIIRMERWEVQTDKSRMNEMGRDGKEGQEGEKEKRIDELKGKEKWEEKKSKTENKTQ